MSARHAPPDVRHYDLHGVPLAVSSDDGGLLDAVHRRLRRFTVDEERDGALTITLDSGGGTLPPFEFDDARPVYDPPLGTVLYAEGSDRLRISYGAIDADCLPGEGRSRIAIGSASAGGRWAATHPILTLCLVETLRRRALFPVHAAALALAGRGVVIAGNSGSGKSTLTLALLRAGFALLGDDTSFLARDSETLRVLGFPDEIGVTERTVRFFPELAPVLRFDRVPGAPKRQLLPEQVYDLTFASETTPSLVLLPRVSGERETRIVDVSPSEALLELVPNVLLTDPRASQEHLDALGALVSGARCCRMATGRDLDALPERVAALLDASLPAARAPGLATA